MCASARARLAGELSSLASAQSRVSELEKERDAILAVAAERARKLSAKRKKAAETCAIRWGKKRTKSRPS